MKPNKIIKEMPLTKLSKLLGISRTSAWRKKKDYKSLTLRQAKKVFNLSYKKIFSEVEKK